MIGLTTSEPASLAAPIASSDHSAQVASSVRASSSTQVSTSVSSTWATDSLELLATQQLHQLIGAHTRRRLAAHAADQAASAGLAVRCANDPQRSAIVDDLDLGALAQVVPAP